MKKLVNCANFGHKPPPPPLFIPSICFIWGGLPNLIQYYTGRGVFPVYYNITYISYDIYKSSCTSLVFYATFGRFFTFFGDNFSKAKNALVLMFTLFACLWNIYVKGVVWSWFLCTTYCVEDMDFLGWWHTFVAPLDYHSDKREI